MKVFVDTSALIALLDADDRRHAQARRAFAWLVRHAELLTHNYIEVEAIAVVRWRLGAGAAEALSDRILPLITVVWVEEVVHREARAALRAAGGSASLVDHVSFVLMRRLGIDTAFVFDADFAAQGFRPVTVPPETDRPERLSETAAPYGGLETAASDLVSVAEIAARAGGTVNTVQSWRRRHPDFPAPVAQLAAGPIWTWPAVSHWIDGRARPRAASREG